MPPNLYRHILKPLGRVMQHGATRRGMCTLLGLAAEELDRDADPELVANRLLVLTRRHRGLSVARACRVVLAKTLASCDVREREKRTLRRALHVLSKLGSEDVDDRFVAGVRGEIADSYSVEDILGGRFVIAIRAVEYALGRDVLIKVLRPGFARTCPNAKAVFRRYARYAGEVHCPGVARVLTARFHAKVDLFVAEYASGRPLASFVRCGLTTATSIAAREFRRIAIQILEVLSTLERAGRIHAYLCADNIFVDDDGSVRVTPFGILPIGQRSSDLHSLHAGRPDVRSYFSAEHAARPLNQAAHQYSAGVVLREMLALLSSRVRACTSMAKVDKVVQKLAAVSPTRRFQSARHALAEFARATEWMEEDRQGAKPADFVRQLRRDSLAQRRDSQVCLTSLGRLQADPPRWQRFLESFSAT